MKPKKKLPFTVTTEPYTIRGFQGKGTSGGGSSGSGGGKGGGGGSNGGGPCHR